MYRAALEQLPPISYNTARKLFGHLHFISSQSSKNLMPVDNLASLWGPTLLHHEVILREKVAGCSINILTLISVVVVDTPYFFKVSCLALHFEMDLGLIIAI